MKIYKLKLEGKHPELITQNELYENLILCDEFKSLEYLGEISDTQIKLNIGDKLPITISDIKSTRTSSLEDLKFNIKYELLKMFDQKYLSQLLLEAKDLVFKGEINDIVYKNSNKSDDKVFIDIIRVIEKFCSSFDDCSLCPIRDEDECYSNVTKLKLTINYEKILEYLDL